MKFNKWLTYIFGFIFLFIWGFSYVYAEDLELLYPQSMNLPRSYSFCESSNENAVKITSISVDGVVTIKATGLGSADIRCSGDLGEVHYYVTTKEKSSNDSGNASNNNGFDTSASNDEPCKYVIGSINDHNSFAYFLNQIFKLIKIAGPLLAVVMTIVDAVKAVVNQDKDTMSKFVNKTIKRIIFAVLLFVIPSLLDFVFRLVGIYGVCDIGLN